MNADFIGEINERISIDQFESALDLIKKNKILRNLNIIEKCKKLYY